MVISRILFQFRIQVDLVLRYHFKVEAMYEPGTFDGDKGRATIEYNGKRYVRPYTKALDDAGRKWSANDRRFLNPISKNVILMNPNIEQNPGWEE